MPDPLRIAVLGPESSGKTTLVDDLHARLRSREVPVAVVAEQGRLLAEQLPPGHPWSFREQLATSLMYQAAEARAAVVLRTHDQRGVLLSDGSPSTPLVWHLRAMRSRPTYDAGPSEVAERLLTAVESAEYDLIMVTSPDIPFVADGIRDDPHGRQDAFEQYRMLFPDATIIAGDHREEQARTVAFQLLRAAGLDMQMPHQPG